MRITFILAVALSMAFCSTPCWADGGVFPPKEKPEGSVREPGQRAVILHADGTEHMVLSVDFEGDLDAFAWVVPLPSKPEIRLVEHDLFREIDQVLHARARARYQQSEEADSGFEATFDDGGEDSATPPAVVVVSRRQVGPYDTAVLRCQGDASSLLDWLKTNGYQVPAQASPVLQHYVDRKAYFAAMRMAARGEETMAVKPLLFSFSSERPYFPLRMTAINPGLTEVELCLFTAESHTPLQDRVFSDPWGHRAIRYSPHPLFRVDGVERFNGAQARAELPRCLEVLPSLGLSTHVLTVLHSRLTPALMTDDVVFPRSGVELDALEKILGRDEQVRTLLDGVKNGTPGSGRALLALLWFGTEPMDLPPRRRGLVMGDTDAFRKSTLEKADLLFQACVKALGENPGAEETAYALKIITILEDEGLDLAPHKAALKPVLMATLSRDYGVTLKSESLSFHHDLVTVRIFKGAAALLKCIDERRFLKAVVDLTMRARDSQIQVCLTHLIGDFDERVAFFQDQRLDALMRTAEGPLWIEALLGFVQDFQKKANPLALDAVLWSLLNLRAEGEKVPGAEAAVLKAFRTVRVPGEKRYATAFLRYFSVSGRSEVLPLAKPWLGLAQKDDDLAQALFLFYGACKSPDALSLASDWLKQGKPVHPAARYLVEAGLKAGSRPLAARLGRELASWDEAGPTHESAESTGVCAEALAMIDAKGNAERLAVAFDAVLAARKHGTVVWFGRPQWADVREVLGKVALALAMGLKAAGRSEAALWTLAESYPEASTRARARKELSVQLKDAWDGRQLTRMNDAIGEYVSYLESSHPRRRLHAARILVVAGPAVQPILAAAWRKGSQTAGTVLEIRNWTSLLTASGVKQRKACTLAWDLATGDGAALAAAARRSDLLGSKPLPILDKLFRHADATVRWHALKRARKNKTPGVAPLARKLLADEDAVVRRQAALYLFTLDKAGAADAVASLLADPHPAVKATAARVCGQLQHSAAAPDLALLLASPDRAVRVAAVTGLCHLEPKVRGWPSRVELIKTLPTILEKDAMGFYGEDLRAVLGACTRLFPRNRNTLLPAVQQLTRHPSELARWLAVLALGWIGTQSAYERVAVLLADPSCTVYLDAADVLRGNRGGKAEGARFALAERLCVWIVENERSPCWNYPGKGDRNEPQEDPVPHMLYADSDSEWQRAARALMAMGGGLAVEWILRRLGKTQDVDDRQELAMLASRLSHPEISARLEKGWPKGSKGATVTLEDAVKRISAASAVPLSLDSSLGDKVGKCEVWLMGNSEEEETFGLALDGLLGNLEECPGAPYTAVFTKDGVLILPLAEALKRKAWSR